jgi:hypothetical protein
MAALFEQLKTFTKELIAMYPKDPDFPLFKRNVKMAKLTNPSFVVKSIYECTQPFSEKIAKKDEGFFMQYSFSEYEKDVGDMNLFGKLKKYIESMPEQSKNNVWAYIQNIHRLAVAITNLK